MAEQFTQNKPLVAAAYRFSSLVPKPQRSPKAFDVNAYQGLGSGSMGTDASTPQFTPASFKNLGTITTPYGGQTRFEAQHPAVDIANKIGTPIPSFVSGTVTDVAQGKRQGDKGYGNYVVVTDAQGNKHRYSHLNKAFVRIGEKVQRGRTIGQMGNTGSTYSQHGGTGSHLDYRIMDAYNKYVNPMRFNYF